MSEAMMYSPSVASRDMTIFLKIGLVKIDENESFCAASIFSMPLNASRNAAVCQTAMSRVSAISMVVEVTGKTDRHIHRNDCEPNHRTRVTPLTTLRPVTEREDKAHDEQAEVCII